VNEPSDVWIFNGNRGQFPGGVFSSREIAEKWIAHHKLSGTLTKYPLDTGAFDWATSKGYFTPKRPDQQSPDFIGKFSDASQEHYHYETGALGIE
jgi:hypothetical protein